MKAKSEDKLPMPISLGDASSISDIRPPMLSVLAFISLSLKTVSNMSAYRPD